MRPRPARSTLFPYTTLFRSGRVTEIFGPESSGKTTLALHVVAHSQRQGGAAAYIDAEQDRKSTRLNSSHRCISYAVFCLKKKTQNPQLISRIHDTKYRNIA